ncbi:LamG-like jellyroll fold domain-containing protein [Corynebacterium renale]|uniref:Calcineurin-like phosphoesterase family protein n=1 Tax=Corynebacterium renale TaxID=1724 RepID=A0A2A9DSF7_9CORY|nr:LamG-like jellyroll fold domain-containing protein [Corynebacterium renale]PFG28849.1 calcineurin-like phosphoesterase family protein [Corynebacterium renale]SQI25661.1 phosphoesterase [Corynebacterium renale]
MRKPIVACVATSLLFSLTPYAQAQELASRFTLGVMPDTQFYSRYGTEATGNLYVERYGSNPYNVQAQWLAQHNQDLNMPFAMHLGDVVDRASYADEWQVADSAMQILDNDDLNYSILPGNHDLLQGANPFGETFTVERAAQNSTFGERVTHNYNGYPIDSEYHIFEAEGQKYLVLALGWRAPQETLDWAQSVLDANPTLPVILTSHEITNIDGAGTVYLSDDYGKRLWDTFIKKNDQIFLTMAGHHHGAGYTETTNDAGNRVIHILQDYQMAYQGGNGLLGVLQFDLTNNVLEMSAFSPWVSQKEHGKLTQFDHLIPEGTGDSYRIDLNFDERFAGFNETWEPGTADDIDYAAKARDMVKDNYSPYVITEADRPQSMQDFPAVEGTAVHWRPGSTTANGKSLNDGDVVPVGAIIPDATGLSPMTRAGLSGAAVMEDVTYTTDVHPLSSDKGALVWSKPIDRFDVNFFETATGAPINEQNFPNGYTLEAFVKIDERFDGDEHGWADALIREKRVKDADPTNSDGDPAQMLGVSSLRELRWWSYGENFKGHSNWSHEVPKGQWLHVAVVNDPKKNMVEMFIDGAPILRDGSGPVGLADGGKWIMGTSATDGTPTDPWFGSIGEVRIVDHPISSNQWLTARAETQNPQPGNSSDQGSSATAGSAIASGILGMIIGGLLTALTLAAPPMKEIFDRIKSHLGF